MQIAVGIGDDGRVEFVDPEHPAEPVAEAEYTASAPVFARLEREFAPRWVWADTRQWYPGLLASGVRLARCHDLRLCGAILDHSTSTAEMRTRGGHPAPAWLPPGPTMVEAVVTAGAPAGAQHETLFDLDLDLEGPSADHAEVHGRADAAGGRVSASSVADEYRRQMALVEGGTAPAALRLLVAAESAGALIGAEMRAAGLPWSRLVHESVLEATLGARPAPGRKPARMEEIAAEVRAELGAPTLNLDSQVDVLRALRTAGVPTSSTSRWELREHDHPAIEPLIAYKKLARLLSANGWTWLEDWVRDDRFRPEYVPGGTATGRWATSGGGALQLPKLVRSAVVADAGWTLVVADAAQLEPRVLTGMSRDKAMERAGHGRDLYRGLVDSGVVATRDEAKVAILGAMYGATTGDSGRLVPRLARAFPHAMRLVDAAARDGERGLQVTTLLGRSSPVPPAEWRATQASASQPDATPADERRARSSARDWGRFTRNFVVQGSAAEWALCWMADLRTRLDAIGRTVSEGVRPAAASGPVFDRVPHLVYFLHDEIIVHTPVEHAEAVAEAVRASAVTAGRLLFGGFPVEFPLDLAVVDSYASADA
ncbi:DNA polymerase-1 [Agromyces sp. CF514]|uniref:bifunctional 3'-5' exonuclease/DNA polymerase n=1 Tax=Agromyces sp. CF514 TaxID=1881031 RepID=UPI0008EDF092|nr:bifunctional 3'-5' exonuclease/DNA polymerase [Agromyces sp. CF514]SFR78226.1 DNA polymerase-1 [Agromyces sp. CF514]